MTTQTPTWLLFRLTNQLQKLDTKEIYPNILYKDWRPQKSNQIKQNINHRNIIYNIKIIILYQYYPCYW